VLARYLQTLESGGAADVDLLARCLRRIVETEPDVRAWVQVVRPTAIGDGPLSGLPFGVKDIFETRGMATEYGSPLYEGRKGEYDAAVVAGLQRRGAVLLGKTRTSPFASFDPTATRNPRAPGRTPGGSSAGSAAAVAAGMVPFALGTQTLGSVLRPASFCGVCGFKPTFGLLSTEGVMEFAPSLDTVGLFTGSAEDMAELWPRAFGGPAVEGELRRAARLRVPCDAPMQAAMDRAVARLRESGVGVHDLEEPEGWAALTEAARTVNTYEGARSQRERLEMHGEKIGVRLAALVREGLAMPRAEYERAMCHVACMKVRMQQLFAEYPCVLTPAAQGWAPEGYGSTGDPAHNAPWTALGTPAISVPLPVDGPPLGMQMTASWGQDAALLAMACAAARAANYTERR
jgi:Asp-tRNA(Asn)/Glu-tRNA(Gln) amidotransferase A subunit family amidase